MCSTSSSDSITQLYASIEEFDGDIDRLINDWGNLYPSVKDQLETTNELDLMNGFAEILFDNGKLDLATSVDENIYEILESDAENEIDGESRDRFYSLISGRWSVQANSPTATNSGETAFSHENETPRSYTPVSNPSLSQFNTAILHGDEIPRSCTPMANPARKLNPGQSSQLGHGHLSPTPDVLNKADSSERTTNERSLPDQESPPHRSPATDAGRAQENTSLAPLLGQSNAPSFGPKQQSQAGLWQTLVQNKTHKFMYGKDEQFFGTTGIGGPAYEPIKIAVLDSDISPKHLKPFRMRIKARENFAGGQQNAADTDHGTTVAELVLKTCPTAHVYIAQVTKVNASGESAVDAEAAAKAIEHAADPKRWGVDIITMSFGWTHINKRISEALSVAKQHRVLMFASTTNYGLAETNSILYPGRAQEVICVDAAEDTGQLAGFAVEDISQGRIERFSAPGLGISSAISGEAMDGSSFACPLAAGIAALALEFTRQFPLCDSASVQEAIQHREGMVSVLRKMSKLYSSSSSRFLCPWELLGDDDGVYGGDGQPGSARYFAAYRVVRALRQEFGSDIGSEIFSLK
ncbi:peptidase S8/S53 domain-containing protein [Trichoderma austrokoningii]